jgi:hypothetical protein
MMFKQISVGLETLGATAAEAQTVFILHWQLHWGAAHEEVHQPLPDDSLIPHPKMESTRAIKIQAHPANIRSWLMQIGTGQAGWYSYDWLEKLSPLKLGCGYVFQYLSYSADQ